MRQNVFSTDTITSGIYVITIPFFPDLATHPDFPHIPINSQRNCVTTSELCFGFHSILESNAVCSALECTDQPTNRPFHMNDPIPHPRSRQPHLRDCDCRRTRDRAIHQSLIISRQTQRKEVIVQILLLY